MAERISFYDQISRNKRNSIFLIILVLAVLMVLGYIIGIVLGPEYFTIVMILSIIISLAYIWAGYYYSDKIALASVNAKPADKIQHKQLLNNVESMSLASGLPMPRVYVMENSQINAFATGRDPKNAVICVTTGALEKLDKRELEGVIAHEMGHIANFDIRFMTLIAVLVGMVAIISEIFLRSLWFKSDSDKDNRASIIFMIIGIALAILAPLVTSLIQLAVSRKREYTADATAVKFTRTPTGLVAALKKIHSEHAPANKHQINKAVAPLFISDPFKSKIQNLFSTHPPIERRIEILQRM
ncbi:M48 family metallopeptidase [Candidatus Pacearchaeota archaeon]|nr:M48 family metallopeptidase [Candidatus Pacearchaeota archaeon]